MQTSESKYFKKSLKFVTGKKYGIVINLSELISRYKSNFCVSVLFAPELYNNPICSLILHEQCGVAVHFCCCSMHSKVVFLHFFISALSFY